MCISLYRYFSVNFDLIDDLTTTTNIKNILMLIDCVVGAGGDIHKAGTFLITSQTNRSHIVRTRTDQR